MEKLSLESKEGSHILLIVIVDGSEELEAKLLLRSSTFKCGAAKKFVDACEIENEVESFVKSCVFFTVEEVEPAANLVLT